MSCFEIEMMMIYSYCLHGIRFNFTVAYSYNVIKSEF